MTPSSEKKENPPKPEIVVLYCQHCAAKNADTGVGRRALSRLRARLVMMPCSSKVDASQLFQLLAEGADGVEVVACPYQQCRLLEGNVRAEKRVDHARRLLAEAGLNVERVGIQRGSNLSGLDLMLLAEKRAEAVKKGNAHATAAPERKAS